MLAAERARCRSPLVALADGWDTWVRYRRGASFSRFRCFFGFAVAEALECVRSVSPVLSLLVPTGLTFLLIVVRWYVLTKSCGRRAQTLGMGAPTPKAQETRAISGRNEPLQAVYR